jgi:hypothetical protein
MASVRIHLDGRTGSAVIRKPADPKGGVHDFEAREIFVLEKPKKDHPVTPM